AGLTEALKKAETMALNLASRKKHKVKIAATQLAKGDFFIPGYDELENTSWEEKFKLVKNAEEKLRSSSQKVESATCKYSEVFEEKMILTTDGADSHIKLVRPEFRLAAFAADGALRTRGAESLGATGNWQCLFRDNTVDTLVEKAGK